MDRTQRRPAIAEEAAKFACRKVRISQDEVRAASYHLEHHPRIETPVGARYEGGHREVEEIVDGDEQLPRADHGYVIVRRPKEIDVTWCTCEELPLLRDRVDPSSTRDDPHRISTGPLMHGDAVRIAQQKKT